MSSAACELTITVLVALVISITVSVPAVVHASSDSVHPSSQTDTSVILMIGDGMGFEHIQLARWVEVGKTMNLTMESGLFNWSVDTYSADAAITDSAAAATAMSTGVKTNNGRVAIGPSGEVLDTIVEIGQSIGRATGVISTTVVYHATPAAFLSHVMDRDYYSQIVQQMVQDSNVSVILGGGKSYFTSDQLSTMAADGYALVTNRSHLSEVSSGKVLGLFSDSHMPYEHVRDYNLTPSLAEMTSKAIEILDQDPEGFFLMVEGGQIDFAAHDQIAEDVALEVIAFDEAVNVSLQYVQSHPNTILIVTADHETGGLLITGDSLNGNVPSGSMTEDERRTLRIERANNITTSWSTTSHTAVDVPAFLFGSNFTGLPATNEIDNTDMFDIMCEYLTGLEAPIHTTTTTTTTTTTETTTTITTTTTTTPVAPFPVEYLIIGLSVAAVAIVLLLLIIVRRRPSIQT